MKFLVLLAALGLSLPLFGQANRYRQAVFPQVTKTANVVYASAIPYSTSSNAPQDLALDVYEPTGDTASLRPVVVAVYGGSFVAGSKDAADIVAWCDSLARHGYVCVAPNYRLGLNFFGGQGSTIRAGYRALQDARACVRYLHSVQATYRIDTNAIFMLGNSAGAITTLQTAYASDADRPAASYGIATAQDNDTLDLGCLDCSGNSLTHSVVLRGIVGLWGAVLEPSVIDSNDHTPALLIHGTADNTVPHYRGNAFSQPSQPILYGSQYIDSLLQGIGVRSELHLYDSLPHNFYYTGSAFPNAYWDTLFPMGRDFLCSLNPYCLPPVAVENLAAATWSVQVMPNPTRGEIWLQTQATETLQAQLFDAQGRLVWKQTLMQNSQALSLRELPAGLYILRVSDGVQAESKMIQKID